MPILNWLSRNEDIRSADCAPYRLLEDSSSHSAGERDTRNMLIQGDNLEALKALLPFYAGRVKCIYIDPPYNTKSAFEHYDDNLEHSIWLSLMFTRLEFMRELLMDGGSIFVQIDDNEGDYLKVILDETFGRKNFVSRISVKTRSPSAFSTVNPGVFKSAEYILWYAKRKDRLAQNRIWVKRDPDLAYDRFIENVEEPYSDWKISGIGEHLNLDMAKYSIKSQLGKLERFYTKEANKIIRTAMISDTGAGADTVRAKQESLQKPNQIVVHRREGHDPVYILNGEQIIFYSKNIRKVDGQSVPASMLTNIWTDIAWEGIANEGKVRFPRGKKPERLVKRILELATNPGDLVLDSFLGSGTTAAVAHKMGRQYIGIEMGDHAVTHCVPRLKKVIEGEQGGISEAVNWQGGGGFRFYRLGPPVFDEDGHIHPDIRFPVLASHIWFSETDQPWAGAFALTTSKGKTCNEHQSPLLGVKDGHAYALLYNGILGDKRPKGGNVLTRTTLSLIRKEVAKAAPEFGKGNPSYPLTIYGEQSRLTPPTLERENITFKQTPYDIKARG